MMRALAILLAAVLLAGCAGERPRNAVCPAVTTGKNQPDFDATITAMMNSRFNLPKGQKRDHVAILLLSGGGGWGAYGAGFLSGWSQRSDMPRPRFDVVTGVSTGAIMAPFALLGPSRDPLLQQSYRGVASGDLFGARTILTLPFWNSLKTADQLQARLKAALDDQALAGLGAAAREGRSVWVGAVNFDTGEFSEFDLTAFAGTLKAEQARKAIVKRIMAASAIPVYLPPKFIGGCMYMDGGVRENLFIAQIAAAIQRSIGGWRALGEADVDIYAVINGPTRPLRLLTDNNLIAIGARGFDLGADQIQLGSLREVYDFAHKNGFTLHWTSADDVVSEPGRAAPPLCEPPVNVNDGFDAAFTACLFDAGRKKALSDPSPWRTDRP
ncbi:MAG: patatin-like phospholipase family protein [Rhizomicrobium sp.]